VIFIKKVIRIIPNWYFYCFIAEAQTGMKKILLLLLLAGIKNFSSVSCQDSYFYTDQVLNEKIKTVQLYKDGWNLSYPLMKLNTDDRMVLHFDLLGNEPETYYYSFIHCDKDWNKSDIYPSDYLEGFSENQIEEYKPSFNTKVNYYHYKVTFPNDRVSIKLSGNYIMIVYPLGYPEKPVLTKRFMVTEDAALIQANAHRPQLAEYYNKGQQVDFIINYSGLNIDDPYREISSFILQNGQWTNARSNLKPDFVGNNKLTYNSLSTKNIFPGGNEFRYFDIKSIRYQSEFIRKIDFVGNNYHVFLFPSENRESKPYFFWHDFNGKYYIAIQEGRDMNTEADYLYVYFTLPSIYEITDGKMYVSGGLNNWVFNKDNIMTYDPSKAEYQLTMLLKQGWYNYEYIFIRDGEKTGEPSLFEGNHYETENDYIILVYYRNPFYRYDRLIGSSVINSTRSG
jgi:hypothetical protein